MIRAFVGISLPEDVCALLETAQAGLPVGRAVAPEAFHLTLAFLGEQQEPVVEDVHHALGEIDGPAPTLRIAGLGSFGGEKLRILHAAVEGDEALKRLRARVGAAVRGAGIDLPRERFVPHVTLARFGRPPEGLDRIALEAFVARRVDLRSPPFRVEELTLFRSHRTAAGSACEVLATYPLA